MNDKKYEKHVFVCTHKRSPESDRPDCGSCGGDELRGRLVKKINQYGLKGKIRINKSGCLDVCEKGPALVIYPKGYWYLNVNNSQLDQIVEESILNDSCVEEWVATKKDFEAIGKMRLK